MLRRLGLQLPDVVLDRVWAAAKSELFFKDKYRSLGKDEVKSMCSIAMLEAGTCDETFIDRFESIFQRELRKHFSRRWVKPAGPRTSYHQSLILETEYNILHAAIGDLDGEQERLIRLRFWHEKTLHELADAISVSVSTIQRKLNTAVSFLRRTITSRVEKSVSLFQRYLG